MVSGICFTQVTQLVAQNLTSTTLPRRSCIEKVLPSSVVNVTSGAVWAGAPDEPGADADGDQHGQGYDGFFHLMGIASTPLLVPAALLSLGAAPAPL